MNPAHIALSSARIPFIAVAICRTSHGNLHTGVVFRRANGDIRFFHQAWDHITRDDSLRQGSEEMGGPFLCIVPPVEDDRAIAIAEFWEFVASRGEQIGYALRDDPDALFDPVTGTLALPNGRGLSCSTFVLVLFRSVRFPYIDTTDWPTGRPGDPEAQAALVGSLERTCPDLNHVEGVRREIGCERVRPEEVSGAALYPMLPVQHPAVEDAGFFVRGSVHMRGLGPPPHWME
jgi:hypothetical protein